MKGIGSRDDPSEREPNLEDRLVRKSLSFIVLTILAASVSLALSPADGSAQRRRNPNLKKLLIVPPMPASESDSAYAVAFAEQARRRAAGRLRNQMRVFDTETYCEALEKSGFDCGTLLDNTAAEQLARFMTADGYIVGSLGREASAPEAELHLIDLGRSGLAGVIHLVGTPGESPNDLAKAFGDSLRDPAQAAKFVRECTDRRNRGDLKGARDRAERAFQINPNHPAAALCVAYLFEATDQPVDSLIAMYKKVVAGDPLFRRGWERLGRLYFQQGDTVSAIQAFAGQLQADPTNDELRIQISGMWAQIDSVQEALDVLEGGVALDRNVESFLESEARICVEAENWSCALDAYTRRYEHNPELGKDEAFLQQVIGAADFAADTTARVRWNGLAVENFPDRNVFLSNYAAALKDAGLADSSLAIFRKLAEREPDNTRWLLAIASTLIDRVAIDSTTPLDTATLSEVDSLLRKTKELAAEDESVLRSVAVLYLRPGLQLAQLRLHPRVAAEWLARSLELPLPGRVKPQAEFFLGFVTVLYLGDLFGEVRDAETCEAVDMYEAQVLRGKNALMAGRNVSPDLAQRLLEGQYSRFEEVIPQFRAAWECSTPPGR